MIDAPMVPGQIYIGDAMRGIRTLSPGVVDAVVMDPPYSSGGAFRGDRAKNTDKKYTQSTAARRFETFDGDTRDGHSFLAWMSIILADARAATKVGGAVAVFTDWRQLASMTDAVQIAGWVFRGVAVWSKPTARPVKGRPTNSCEFVVWGTNGPRDVAGECIPGHWHVPAPHDRLHPTQKPLAVMQSLVRLAPFGGVVLDPFLGSATTAVAARAEGRRWLGCESNPHYAEISRARIESSQIVGRDFALEMDDEEGLELDLS